METQASPRDRRTSFSVTGRRQNKSCDQCRKGKRACDAASLDISKARPCSNCDKTGKGCTFNWLLPSSKVPNKTLTRGQKQATVPGYIDNHIATKDARASEDPSSFGPDQSCSTFDHTSLQDGFEFLDNPHTLQLGYMEPMSLSFPTAEKSHQYLQTDFAPSWQGNTPSVFSVPSLQSEDSLVEENFPLDFDVEEYGQASQIMRTLDNVPTREVDEELRPGKRRRRSGFGRRATGPRSRSSFGSNQQRPNSNSSRRWSIISDPSSDSLPQRLASSACTSQISGGLMRIYHDSMENALSCWLNETTCPYNFRPSSHHKGQNLLESMSDEWGPNWSNRICSRVCRLDKVAFATRDRALTKSEDQAASRALQTAIMSFATQWAQSSQRSAREYSSLADAEKDADNLNLDGFPYDDSPAPTEFDRVMQEMFWHQARQALQDTAEIQSFRVIFAHIVFSLTQRPLNVDQQERQMKERRSRSSGLDDFQSPLSDHSNRVTSETFAAAEENSIVDELDEIIQSEGPPLFLEIALRQMHSYRCKLDALEREKEILARDAGSTQKKADPLTADDRKTFDMLFWLGVMFDTLSSAMHKRPLVVSDEDSDIISDSISDPPARNQFNGYEEGFGNDSISETSLTSGDYGSTLWGQFFFQQKRTQHYEDIVRWPCTYEKAAATLSYAAPIKVLLFRKVSHLQTLLSRRARQEKFEEGISAALRVYQHWNDEYGPFILDCVANHDALPPRIQSWYIVLAGHWHLGAMLLADMIELVDKAKMSFVSRRLQRRSSQLVTSLRTQNAYAVSELGKCSCPRSDASFPNFREFHFAVNKGALLTEPWTVVLIRSFAKAGTLLLDMMAQGHKRGSGVDAIEQIRRRCEYCIEALWHLGKKSDMAYLAATALSTALKEERRRFTGFTSNVSSDTGIQDWELAMEEEQGQLDPGFDDPFSFHFAEGGAYQNFMAPAVTTA